MLFALFHYRPLCYINLMYQVSKFYRKKSLSNQKVYLRLLKCNVTNSILKFPRKKNSNDFFCTAPDTFTVRKKNYLSYLPNQTYVFRG